MTSYSSTVVSCFLPQRVLCRVIIKGVDVGRTSRVCGHGWPIG